MTFDVLARRRRPSRAGRRSPSRGCRRGSTRSRSSERRPLGKDRPEPAGRTWTVERRRRTVTATACSTARDNCPDNANAGAGRRDRDGVGDACEVLPSGNDSGRGRQGRDGEAARRRGVRQAAARGGRSAFTTGLRVPFQSSGFLPLKGVAAVPMGSTLDTRAGEVALTAAVNGQPPAAAGRCARGAVPRGHLRDPPGAQEAQGEGLEADPAARRARPARPAPSGRARQGTAEGRRRPLPVDDREGRLPHRRRRGDRAPAKGTSTFITTDRCDGTITEVGRGRVAVIAKRTGKREVVRAGRAYIVAGRGCSPRARGAAC